MKFCYKYLKGFKMRNVLILFTLIIINFNISFSQFPPCYVKSQQDFMGLTCSIKFYKTSPPLNLDMPENVVRAYLYLDSIGALNKESFENFDKQMKSELYNSDFVKDIMKKLMLVKQFDEIRYFLFRSKPDMSRYLNFTFIFNSIQRKNKCDSLASIYFQTSSILKVKLTDSVSRYNSNKEADGPIYQGVIKEILYGPNIPTIKDISIPIDSEHYNYNNPELRLIKENDSIQFDHFIYSNILFNTITNKTYYIFFNFGPYCSNYEYAFSMLNICYDFDIDKTKFTKMYVFEVNGEIVSDPQHIFTQSGYLSTKQFKSVVLNELDQARKYGTIQRDLLRVDDNSETTISIFPNPVSNTISFKGLNNSETCTIFNSLGIQVFSGEINPSSNIDIDSYPIGVYFLKYHNQIYKFEVVN